MYSILFYCTVLYILIEAARTEKGTEKRKGIKKEKEKGKGKKFF